MWLRIPHFTLQYLPKREENLGSHKSLSMNIGNSLNHNHSKLEAQISLNRWIMSTLWSICVCMNIYTNAHTYEHYSEIKRNKPWRHGITCNNLKYIKPGKKARLKKLCTVWFHLYDIPEKEKVSRQETDQSLPESGSWLQKGMRKFGCIMFSILIAIVLHNCMHFPKLRIVYTHTHTYVKALAKKGQPQA